MIWKYFSNNSVIYNPIIVEQKLHLIFNENNNNENRKKNSRFWISIQLIGNLCADNSIWSVSLDEKIEIFFQIVCLYVSSFILFDLSAHLHSNQAHENSFRHSSYSVWFNIVGILRNVCLNVKFKVNEAKQRTIYLLYSMFIGKIERYT